MEKKTPFYNKHIEGGGRIINFFGWLMPIQYKSIIEEVKIVRTRVGVFDVSHMGRIEISGPDAEEFVNYITTNDVRKLAMFQSQYSCMCYPDGGIVDDMLVYRLLDKFLLVINASNREKDYNWIIENKKGSVDIVDVGDKIAQLAIQGPKTEPIIQPIIDIDLSGIKYYRGAYCKINNVDTFISRTGYTGEDGFELYFDSKYADEIYDKVISCGIEPVGLGARDILRLEMRYCLYGNDITKDTTPLEAGLGWITKLDKPNFIGKEALLKQKSEGIKRKLISFIMKSRAIPRQHYKIIVGNKEEGEVTSGNFSPTINKSIGLGYINVAFADVGTHIYIDCKGKLEEAEIVQPPFYKNASHK